MREQPAIQIVGYASASTEAQERGLLGRFSLVYGQLRLDRVALRRTRAGRLTLSFPEPRDRRGKPVSLVRPLDDAARREIEAQVFEALGREALP